MTGLDRLPALTRINPALPEVPMAGAAPKAGSFVDTLQQFVGDVNEMQIQSNDKAKQFATGQIKDIHEVMASAEEASISMMLLMEIRNKAVDAYKELIRTPV